MDDVIFGYNGNEENICLSKADRRQHLYVAGMTGTGKTTMLENLALQDIRAGRGVAFFDPHGDSTERLLRSIPAGRTNDVVYINPDDARGIVGLNLLDAKTEKEKYRAALAAVSIFKQIFGEESWGDRLGWLLLCSVRSLMEYPNATLLDVFRILVDEEFRKKVISRVHIKPILWYWNAVFDEFGSKLESEAISPVINRIGRLLINPWIQPFVGTRKSTIDIGHILETRKIVIVALPKGLIGEDTASLLGGILIGKFYIAALERQKTPEEERQDYYMYIDEFQTFANSTFIKILPEVRKYRLNFTLAHQYLDQIPEDVFKAVMGSIPSKIVFRVGERDAERLEPEFLPNLRRDDLADVKNHRAHYVRLVNGRKEKSAFSATMFPPATRLGDEANTEKILRISKERYGRMVY